MSKRHYGWKPSHPDHRDLSFNYSENLALPDQIDLRPNCPPVYDQGQLGSCVSNAVAGAIETRLKIEGRPIYNPSRLFIYYNGRVIEGTINSDSGLTCRDGIRSIVKKSVCSEDLWSYNISRFKVKPPKSCYDAAAAKLIDTYESVAQNQMALQSALFQIYPVVVGFSVFSSFESSAVAKTGMVPMPGKNESFLGGHSTLLVGYDNIRKLYILRNSWSANWGDKGYFYLPFDYLHSSKLSGDFWIIKNAN